MIVKAATVQDLINHLQTNFKPTDKLCYWYEGGAYINCEHLFEDDLGHRMFKYVKDDKKRRMETFNETKNQVNEDFEYVSDDDVIIY
jgi:hypothetical protein